MTVSILRTLRLGSIYLVFLLRVFFGALDSDIHLYELPYRGTFMRVYIYPHL